MNELKHLDVLIIGAGLSGVGAGHRLKVSSPWARFEIFESRNSMGGTWDLFRYPGIRSDSDMFTFGYQLRPWDRNEAIGQGADIRQYIIDTAEESGVDKHIRYGHKVVGADWSTDEAIWRVEVERVESGERFTVTADYIHGCAGYYRYDKGYTPDFAGMDDFEGQIIHPQFWPEDLDYADKKIVVIGSGATAITLIPNLAGSAEQVTMLQRTPSYIMAMPQNTAVADLFRKLPAGWDGRALRAFMALSTQTMYHACRRWPDKAKARIMGMTKQMLPKDFDVETHFNPPYDPWDQRLCLSPDGDFFRAIRKGKADVVTDTVSTFTPKGILLDSGAELEADIIITATGLEVLFVGGLEPTVDGETVDVAERMVYRGAMIEGVPNFSFVFGYTNASWTLRADLSNQLMSDLINEMRRRDVAIATPVNDDPSIVEPEENVVGLTSGYIARASNSLPRQGSRRPWKLGQSWWFDRRELKRIDIGGEGMVFSTPRAQLRRTKVAAV